jgi:hypothetical protein
LRIRAIEHLPQLGGGVAAGRAEPGGGGRGGWPLTRRPHVRSLDETSGQHKAPFRVSPDGVVLVPLATKPTVTELPGEIVAS